MRLTKEELPKMIPIGKSKDLTNQKFGKLTALYKCEVKNGISYWICQCECGFYTKVRCTHLTNNNVITCGDGLCRTEDLVGKKFNKLTVMYRVINDKNNNVIWHCKCDCRNETDVISSHLKDGHTTSCGCVLSLGEEKIIKLLIANKIKFQSQKTFEDCRFIDTNAKAKFDFYLPDYNCLIEFDGIQHFYSQETSKIFTKEKLKRTQEHDAFKNQYCLNNDIILIRIPYTHFDNIIIEDLLPATSKFIYAGS